VRPLKPTGSPVRPAETPKTSAADKSPAAAAAKKEAPLYEAKGKPKADFEPAPATQAPVTASPSAMPYVQEHSALLDDLARTGKLGLAIDTERAQRVLCDWSVDTRDRPQQVALPRKKQDLVAIDSQMATLVGPTLWTQLKSASDAAAQRRDDIANAQMLPPEGIHPDFAIAAKDLLKYASKVNVTPQQRHASDAALAKLVAQSPPGAAATLRVFLHQFFIDGRNAPETFAALDAKLPPLTYEQHRALELTTRGPDAESDAQLAALVKGLSPEQLLLAQHTLAEIGVIDDRLTFYGWEAPQKLREGFPQLVSAMQHRDARGELLQEPLAHDAKYQQLRGELRALMTEAAAAAQTSAAAGPLKDYATAAPGNAGHLLDWALLQDQKLRFLNTEATPTPAGVPLAERSIEQTFFDHLRARREGDLEKDLRLNYDPDLVFTENQGNFFGHDGVRRSAAVLAQLVPGREWVMNRLTFSATGPTQGYATEIWSADARGKLVTAVDNFFIKDGKILMQSAYYTDVRSDLTREGHVHTHDALAADPA
jgi:hypothetical protein